MDGTPVIFIFIDILVKIIVPASCENNYVDVVLIIKNLCAGLGLKPSLSSKLSSLCIIDTPDYYDDQTPPPPLLSLVK